MHLKKENCVSLRVFEANDYKVEFLLYLDFVQCNIVYLL